MSNLYFGPDAARLRTALQQAARQEHSPLTSSQVDRLAAATHHRLGNAASLPPYRCLTWRQIDVITCLANDMSLDATAARIHLSAQTVRTHRARAYERLGVHSAAAAVGVCMATQLILPEQITIAARVPEGKIL